MSPRFRLVVGYDGTEFSGSQAQRGRRTVQGELERAVEHIAPGSGRLVFAGRTDRGVHALGQVVSGDIAWSGTPEELRTAINAVAPGDLVVSRVQPAQPGFHARYDALGREYRYRIHTAPAPPVLHRRYVWWRRRPLDPDLARQACVRMIGRRNFGTFAGLGRSRSLDETRLVRTVIACEWRAARVEEYEAASGVEEWRHELRIVADGFLPQMARNMAAAIVTVAEGDRPVEWIDALVAARDRTALGEAAPPEGLTLVRVLYADDAERPVAGDGQAGIEG